MKILIDMNLPPGIVKNFSDYGIEAKHWSTVGVHDAPDEDIFLYAYQNDYIILTCDLDFTTSLAVSKKYMPSVAQIRIKNFHVFEHMGLVINSLTQCKDDLKKGAILTINTERRRLRILPL